MQRTHLDKKKTYFKQVTIVLRQPLSGNQKWHQGRGEKREGGSFLVKIFYSSCLSKNPLFYTRLFFGKPLLLPPSGSFFPTDISSSIAAEKRHTVICLLPRATFGPVNLFIAHWHSQLWLLISKIEWFGPWPQVFKGTFACSNYVLERGVRGGGTVDVWFRHFI